MDRVRPTKRPAPRLTEARTMLVAGGAVTATALSRLRRWILPAGAGLFLLLAAAPAAGAPAGLVERGRPAVFAADAEAWGFSVEVGVSGPLEPMTSHSKAVIDNSPRAAGAAGLVDPGALVRASGEATLGVPAPAYCESAAPEGPREANCAAPGDGEVQVGRAHTLSSDRPSATSTARYGRLLLNVAAAPPATVISVNSQSTIALTRATDSGVEAGSRVVLQGVSLAGGALRIESLRLGRAVRADGTEPGSTISSEVALSGLWVAGVKLDPGRDALGALIGAVRAVYGDRLQVSAGEFVEQRSPDGALSGRTSGLVVRWEASPGRWVRAVLGYVGVMAYGAPLLADTVLDAVIEAPAPMEPPVRLTESRPGVPDDGGPMQPPAPAAPSPAGPGVAVSVAATDVTEVAPTAGTAPPSTDDRVASATPAPAAAAMPYHRRSPRSASPFLVSAPIDRGSQAGWLLPALVPVLVVHRRWRRAASGPRSTG